MTCSIYCDSGRQPCPTPRNCGDGCHFNNAMLETPRDKAFAQFAAMDFPIDMQPDFIDQAITLVQRFAWHIAVVSAGIAALIYFAGKA